MSSRNIKFMLVQLALAVGILWMSPARAQTDMFSKETITVEGDLRLAVVDGEPSWIDGGFGKLRLGSDGPAVLKARVAEVDVAWKPRFGWNLSGLVSLTHQAGQEHVIDINEGFLKFKPVPTGNTHYSARLGLMYPPISLEHSGPNWAVTHSITPSAINSWVGEEIKVVAAEATIGHDFGEHSVSLTGAAFGFNDTSGTLLSYRGWALHDVKATAFGYLPLPPLGASIAPFQVRHSNPVRELDHKIGYYARVDWRPPLPVSLYAFRYDNRGDRVTSRNLQTSWATDFWNIGGTLALDEHSKILSQVMWGKTLVGPDTPYGIPVDVRFSSAYVMGVRDIGRATVSARMDWFKARDRGFVDPAANGEKGWVAMIAVKYPVSSHIKLLLEAQHVNSERAGRNEYSNYATRQKQTLVQTSIRFGF